MGIFLKACFLKSVAGYIQHVPEVVHHADFYENTYK